MSENCRFVILNEASSTPLIRSVLEQRLPIFIPMKIQWLTPRRRHREGHVRSVRRGLTLRMLGDLNGVPRLQHQVMVSSSRDCRNVRHSRRYSVPSKTTKTPSHQCAIGLERQIPLRRRRNRNHLIQTLWYVGFALAIRSPCRQRAIHPQSKGMIFSHTDGHRVLESPGGTFV